MAVPTTLSDFTIHAAADGRCEWETPEDLCGADALLPVLRDAVEGGEDIELYEGLVAGAPPGGMVRRDAYEHMRDNLLADLRRAHEGQTATRGAGNPQEPGPEPWSQKINMKRTPAQARHPAPPPPPPAPLPLPHPRQTLARGLVPAQPSPRR